MNKKELFLNSKGTSGFITIGVQEKNEGIERHETYGFSSYNSSNIIVGNLVPSLLKNLLTQYWYRDSNIIFCNRQFTDEEIDIYIPSKTYQEIIDPRITKLIVDGSDILSLSANEAHQFFKERKNQTVPIILELGGGGKILFILSSPTVANLLKQGRLAFYV